MPIPPVTNRLYHSKWLKDNKFCRIMSKEKEPFLSKASARISATLPAWHQWYKTFFFDTSSNQNKAVFELDKHLHIFPSEAWPLSPLANIRLGLRNLPAKHDRLFNYATSIQEKTFFNIDTWSRVPWRSPDPTRRQPPSKRSSLS